MIKPFHKPDHAYTVNRTCRGYMDAESLYGNMCVVQCLLEEGPVTFCGHSSASTMYANNNICNFETTLRKNTFGFMQRLEQSTNSIISTLYQSWIVRFDIWNSWIKSLYVT